MAENDFTVAEDDTDKTTAEFEKDPRGVYARWMAELQMAGDEEKDYRTEGDAAFKIYEGDDDKAFNILWSNTETVVPSVYNSTPKADVRRRFRDADPVGKIGSKITERALDYSVDVYPFSNHVKLAVLDAELTGRGILRNVYKPTFAPMDQARPTLWSRIKSALGVEAKPQEILVDERAELIHVPWKDFRRGPAKTWADVPWVAFKHEFSRDMADEEFGEKIGKRLKYNEAQGAEKLEGKEAKSAKALFRVCIVWEIHDRIGKRVLWIAECYKDGPLKTSGDELKVDGFFPMPPPLYSILNSRTLIPRSRYRMYKTQAETLERISKRIDKMVEALRVRGLYASVLPELKDMMDATDGDLIPVANATAVADAGGLDKMIWIMPIDRLKVVLEALVVAREQCKQAIYEIVGLSDIVRGATDPNETLGAQELKSQYSSIRLENYQREVQRIIRDGLRIMADMICSRFSAKTLQAITQVQLPSAQDKALAQQAQQQAQMAASAPPVPGAPPPPPPDPSIAGILQMPTWEDVDALLKSDFLRTARIDIETDSTVAETINRDIQGMNETLTALGGFLTAAMPIVQSGMVPVDAAKNVALNIVRRTRMGQVVEDAFEGMQQPAPDAPTESPDDSGAQQAVMTAKASEQKAQIELTEEKAQRALDKREMDLQLREQELGLREEALQQSQQKLQAQGQQLQQQEASLTQIDRPPAGGAPGAIQ